MISLVALVRSLGFGAMLGAGLAGFAGLATVDRLPHGVTLEQIMILGALVGAGLHQFIDTLLFASLLRPLGRFLGYYSRLVQLVLLTDYVGHQRTRAIVQQLTDDYFLHDLRGTEVPKEAARRKKAAGTTRAKPAEH
jgi:hypothetical protein